VTLYFTIPRPAAFSFYEPAPFTVDNSTIAFSPTNFSFSGNLQLLGESWRHRVQIVRGSRSGFARCTLSAFLRTSRSCSSLKKASKQIHADIFAADTSSAYLPTHFTNIQATVYDLNTNKQVATGNYGNHVVPKGQNEPVTLPVTFSYSALNTSDTTCEWGRTMSGRVSARDAASSA
jgi:hypothetical protein